VGLCGTCTVNFEAERHGVERASDEDALMIRPAREGAAYWVGRGLTGSPEAVAGAGPVRSPGLSAGPVGAAWRPRHRPAADEKFPAKYCHLATEGGDWNRRGRRSAGVLRA